MTFDWIDKEPEEKCGECCHIIKVRAMGSSGLKLTCGEHGCECYPSCSILEPIYDETPVAYRFPDGNIGRYCCPNCGSYDINRTPYGDGCGYVDVKLKCESCGKHTWET